MEGLEKNVMFVMEREYLKDLRNNMNFGTAEECLGDCFFRHLCYICQRYFLVLFEEKEFLHPPI
jgi:hypothetical protein